MHLLSCDSPSSPGWILSRQVRAEYNGSNLYRINFSQFNDYRKTVAGLNSKLYELETINKSKKASEPDECIIKTKLSQLNAAFDSLEMDDLKHEEIMSQTQSNEVSEIMEPVLEKFVRASRRKGLQVCSKPNKSGRFVWDIVLHLF